MPNELKGARALVTGAASGIGRAIAVAFAREGAIVAVHARTKSSARETLDEIGRVGGKAFAVTADISISSQVKGLCEAAIDRLGGIDIVVNNAGIVEFGRVVDMDEALWDRIMTVNLKAPFLVTKHVLPAMLEQKKGGSIIFMASTNGKTADAEWSTYNASKHGLLGLSKCLAAEVGNSQIRVNAICPGWIETDMAKDCFRVIAAQAGRPFEAAYDEGMRFNMMKALIPAEEVANMAVFLASEGGRLAGIQSSGRLFLEVFR